MDDRRIHDRPATNRHTAVSQVRVDRFEDALSQPVPLQEVAELADRRLVWDSFTAKVDTDEPAHCDAVVEGFLDGGVAQVEPVLQKVHPQHPFEADRRSSDPTLSWVVALHDLTEPCPRDHLIHFIQKLCTLRPLREALEPSRGERDLLVRHRSILSLNTRRVNQSILRFSRMLLTTRQTTKNTAIPLLPYFAEP